MDPGRSRATRQPICADPGARPRRVPAQPRSVRHAPAVRRPRGRAPCQAAVTDALFPAVSMIVVDLMHMRGCRVTLSRPSAIGPSGAWIPVFGPLSLLSGDHRRNTPAQNELDFSRSRIVRQPHARQNSPRSWTTCTGMDRWGGKASRRRVTGGADDPGGTGCPSPAGPMRRNARRPSSARHAAGRSPGAPWRPAIWRAMRQPFGICLVLCVRADRRQSLVVDRSSAAARAQRQEAKYDDLVVSQRID